MPSASTASLESQVLEWVRNYTGMSQHIPVATLVEYARLKGIDDKALARTVQDLVRSGRLRRTHQVHPGRGEDIREDNTGSLALPESGRARVPAADQLNVRIPHALRHALAAEVGRLGDTLGSVAARALQEWASMQAFPGIDFRSGPAGRRACVTGTGLDVAELCRIWLHHGRDERALLRDYPHLERRQVRAAVAYAESHPEILAAPWGTQPPGVPAVRV
ncbi:MAG: hypothetical protein FD180_1291 [Planctomycetota bacterium]|nr:MAG: hypothetical protein FD180_1291 [Planctomycetota bacterium]